MYSPGSSRRMPANQVWLPMVYMARQYSAMAAPSGSALIAGWQSSALISEAKARRRPSHQ